MHLTSDFRGTVRADIKRNPEFRREMLGQCMESLLSGEVQLAKEMLRDYINATVGFPKVAANTKIHVKTVHQMFGPRGNPTASRLFEIIAYLQRAEGVHFEVRAKKRRFSRGTRQGISGARKAGAPR